MTAFLIAGSRRASPATVAAFHQIALSASDATSMTILAHAGFGLAVIESRPLRVGDANYRSFRYVIPPLD